MKHSGIAVICGKDGKPAPFSGECDIDIYRRKLGGAGKWSCLSSMRFSLGADQSREGVRRAVAKLVEDFEDVRVLVTSSIGGIAYTTLSQAGVCIFEMADFTPDCLDDLVGEVETAQNEEDVPKNPFETESPGVYAFDLAAALAVHPDLSSKKILRPFLDTVKFRLLRLSCGHIPPWLLPDLERRGLSYSRHREEGVTILEIHATQD